ncbi:spore gernimation protein [Paenibacillus nanensis]|uniref:Spore gernimation protein n=1 Tax=Paenibacillus nanensis TaxID=393251 RepID=A0A3A1UME4_9BACL|nr:GerAB/ArcD/ProY family transporter [Paenibacillus nanensis]RIX48639.1 spore gernimation protein [Paenibacillus nanensis]
MKEKLNYIHIVFLLYVVQSNVFLFSVPRIVAENFGTNGWIAFLLCSAAVLLNIFLYALVYKLGKGRSVFDILESSLPKAIVYPIYLAVALFWIALGSFVGKQYMNVLQTVTFPTTNTMLIYLLYAYMLYLLLTKSIYVIGKASILFFLATIWMVALLVYFLPYWDIHNLTPFLFQNAANPVSLKNWLEVYSGFIGYELAVLLIPYAEADNKLFKGVYWGHLLVTFVYFSVILVSYGFFGLRYLQAAQFPLVDLLAFIEFPFINRIENLLLPFFLYKNLMTTVMYCWAAMMMIKRIAPVFKPKVLEGGIALASIGFASYPKLLRDSQLLVRQSIYVEIMLAFAFPLLLMMLLYWQNIRRRGQIHEFEN